METHQYVIMEVCAMLFSSGMIFYLFKTYCYNLYCALLCYDSTKNAMKNLIIAYNNSLRRLLVPSHNSASGMFVNLNIPFFGKLLRKICISLEID